MAEINEQPTVSSRRSKRTLFAGLFPDFFSFWWVLFYDRRFLFYQLETNLVNRVTHFTVADRQTHLQERFAELSPSFLIISGVSITVRCYKTVGRSFPTPATVFEIPTEDLEKSPDLILSYNNIPPRLATIYNGVAVACSTDLPDYFTAV